MPTSSLAQIFLRLFALKTVFLGIAQCLGLAISYNPALFTFTSFFPSVFSIIFGLIIWFISPKFSRILTRKNDHEITLGGITQQHLYTAVFFGLGLYFSLLHFAKTFSWLHYTITTRSFSYEIARQMEPSIYDLTESALTLAAGIFLILTCKKWARKLAK